MIIFDSTAKIACHGVNRTAIVIDFGIIGIKLYHLIIVCEGKVIVAFLAVNSPTIYYRHRQDLGRAVSLC